MAFDQEQEDPSSGAPFTSISDSPVAAGPIPGGQSGADLVQQLMRASGGKTVDQTSPLPPGPAPPDPSADLRAYLEKLSRKTAQDSLYEKLHMTKEDQDGRSKWGNFGQRAGNLAQAVLFGRNFRTEANQDYAAQTTRMQQGNTVLRDEDLAKQAKDALEAKTAYNNSLTDIKQQQVDLATKRLASTEKIQTEGNKIKAQIAGGKSDLDSAKAYVALVDAHNKEHNGGLSGDDGLAYSLAKDVIDGVPPEQIQTKAKMLGLVKSSNALGKVFRLGSDSQSSQSIGPDGNPVTSRSTRAQFGGPPANILQQLLGQGATQTPLQTFGTPAFQGGGPSGAAQAAGGPQGTPPVNPIQHLQNNLPAPPPAPLPDVADTPLGKPMDPQTFLKNHAGEVGGNIAMMKTLQDSDKKTFETAQKLYTAKMLAVEDTGKQRANLANAMISGQDQNYQGFIPALLEKARNIVGDVGSNEALGRPLDYDALYGKLGSSVKGTFKNVEINSATGTLGKRDFNAQNALFLHTANDLSQQAQAAAVSKQFEDSHGRKLMGPEALTQAMADEITRYMSEVKKAQDFTKITGKPQPAPALHSIAQVVQDYRAKNKSSDLIHKLKDMTPAPAAIPASRKAALADLNGH